MKIKILPPNRLYPLDQTMDLDSFKVERSACINYNPKYEDFRSPGKNNISKFDIRVYQEVVKAKKKMNGKRDCAQG